MATAVAAERYAQARIGGLLPASSGSPSVDAPPSRNDPRESKDRNGTATPSSRHGHDRCGLAGVWPRAGRGKPSRMNTFMQILRALPSTLRTAETGVIGTGLIILILAVIGAFAVLAFLIPGD